MSHSEDSGMIPPPPADGPSAPGGPGAVNPLAMTVAQAAKVLSGAGVGAATEELIRRHMAAGAPAGPDGTINLVHYAAWLNLRMEKAEHGA